MLLIALMPGLVPTAAIIPIHAITQLTSNVSRAAFGWRDIDWSLIPAVTLGSWAGTRLRSMIPQKSFHFWFKLLISSLALRMIVLSIIHPIT